LLRFLSFWDAVMLGIAGVCGILVGVVCGMVLNGIRDRVLSILALGVFVVFFWTAFEQAGNVLNLWADKSTDRYVWKNAPPPEIFPEVVEEPVAAKAAAAAAPAPANSLIARFQSMFNLKSTGGPQKTWGEWLSESLNPVPTAWFQSVNALMIFVLAPVFSFIWIYLDRRNRQPSIPMKMTIGLLFVSASVGVMAVAARLEDRPTSAILLGDSLPNGIVTNSAGQLCYPDKQDGKEILVPYAAGRLRFDPATKSLHLTGALPDTERDRIVRDTAPPLFKKQIEDLMAASAKIGQENRTSASIKLEGLPAGFDWRYAGFKSSQVTFDQKSREITAKMELAGKDVKAILVAAGDEKWRNTINELFVESAKHKVSMSWLILSYLLATIGELCISPVGLSMASKLAPAKFATLLMGMWLLTSSFGNFAAGLFGELAETIPPLNLFVLLTVVTFVASLVLFVLVRKVVGMMHGVN
jgi:POT family proton-dependent oligopeptide transporter